MLGQTSELLRASQERVRGGESSLEQTQRRLAKMETAFKATSQEVLKVRTLYEFESHCSALFFFLLKKKSSSITSFNTSDFGVWHTSAKLGDCYI